MVGSRWIKGNHWANAVRFSRYSATRRPRWFYPLIKSIFAYLKDPRKSRGHVKRDPHTSLRLSCPLSVKVSGSVSIRSTLCLRTFLLFSFSLLVSIPVQRSLFTNESTNLPSIAPPCSSRFFSALSQFLRRSSIRFPAIRPPRCRSFGLRHDFSHSSAC